MKTRVAVLSAIGRPVEILELELDDPKECEVLVRMEAAGVCASDSHVMSGATSHPLPAALGHEGAGIVEKTGAGVTRCKVGDRVALSWSPSCSQCADCMRGNPALCQKYLAPVWAGTMLDGTCRLHDPRTGKPVFMYCSLGCFADKIVVSEKSVVVMPMGVPPEVCALIGCAVSTGIGSCTLTARARPGESVVVFGAGGVGLSATMAAAASGCSPVIVVDRVAMKRDVARAVGATHFVKWNASNPEESVKEIRSITDAGEGADIAIEAIGSTELQAKSLDVLRRGGTAVFVGLTPMGTTTPVSGARITREAKIIKGSYYGSVFPERDFIAIARLFLTGKLPIDRMLHSVFELSQINEAYAALKKGKIEGRAIIKFSGATRSKL